MRVVDLFSGLGGFSQAFIDRGHNVVRFDNDEQFSEVEYTIICDVLDLTAEDLCDYVWDIPDIILASPPCNHFSIASVYHHWKNGEPTEATKKQIELVRYTIKLIEEVSPKYWILENPRGMLRRVLGKPNKFLYMAAYGKKAKKPTDLWGVFPPIEWLEPFVWEKAPRGSDSGTQDNSLTPAERALIPYDFSLAVCLAAEGNSPQTTLGEYTE
jgi:hypothetical protein